MNTNVLRTKKNFRQYLATHQLKQTAQRNLILNSFLNATAHLTAEDLYLLVKQKDASIGQTTVYRNLKLLVDSGIADVINLGDGINRYEPKRDDAHHDHIVCLSCKKSFEVANKMLEDLQHQIAAQMGFTLEGHKLVLYGYCSSCQNSNL